MPIPDPGRCCVYKIQENTRGEVLGVERTSPPYIIRWADNNAADQQWIIVPQGAGTCRIINCENGEYMAVGSNGFFVRWEYVDEKAQLFSFVNRSGDAWNILTFGPYANRYATMVGGVVGNTRLEPQPLMRNEADRKTYQQFQLIPVNEKPKPLLEEGEYEPGQIPEIPRLQGFDRHPPERSAFYLIGETIIPATMVQDPNLPDMALRVQKNPYYILRREQYWDRTRCSGGDPCLYEHDGHTTKHYETEITYGYSREQSNAMQRTTDTKLDFEGKFVYGEQSLNIKYAVENQLKVEESTKTKYEESKRVKASLDIPNERFIVCNWVLVNRYTLFNLAREKINSWNVVQYGTGVSDGYPRPLETTLQPYINPS
jgi:Insecticidal Crystal Toxin, P42/Ricin-type beta-trefoil lectin domain-like